MRGKKVRELRRKAERLTVGEEKEVTKRVYKLLKKGKL